MNRPRFHPPNRGSSGGYRGQMFRPPNSASTHSSSRVHPNEISPVESGSSIESGVGEEHKPLFYKPQNSQRPHNRNARESRCHFSQPYQNTQYSDSDPSLNNFNNLSIAASQSRSYSGRRSVEFQANIHSGSLRNIPEQYSSQNSMVLSKMSEPGAGNQAPKEDIVAWLKEYKAIDCSCCNQLIGFQHRVTGLVFCTGGCSKHDGGNANGVLVVPPQPMIGVAEVKQVAPTKANNGVTEVKRVAPAVVNSGFREEPVVRRSEPLAPVPAKLNSTTSRPPPVQEDKSYMHVSSLHKYAGPSAPVESYDAVDKAPPKPVVQDARGTPRQPTIKEDPFEMVPAEAIRKDTNPFFKNIPSVKVMAAQSPSNAAPEIEKASVAAPPPSTERAPPKPKPKVAQAPAPAPAPVVTKPKYRWDECTFSTELERGAVVKTTYVWGLNKYQICADADEENLVVFQDKIQTYVKQTKPMTRKPFVGEVVLGMYGEDYYRGRVISVADTTCRLIFVDFGDENHESPLSTIIEPDDYLMGFPIFSVTVELSGVPREDKLPKIKTPKGLNEYIFGNLQLDMIDELVAGDNLAYEAKLWVSPEQTLNNLVNQALDKIAHPEDEELEDYLRYHAFVKSLRTVQEGMMAEYAAFLGVENYRFDLDDSTTPYFLTALRLYNLRTDTIHTAEVTTVEGIDDVDCLPHTLDDKRDFISRKIERFVAAKDGSVKEKFSPEEFQIYAVKWLPWREVEVALSDCFGMRLGKWRSTIDQTQYNEMKKYEMRYGGKWYRGMFMKECVTREDKSNICSWFYLVDICKDILVPTRYVHQPSGVLMTMPQLACKLTFALSGVGQYTPEAHEKFKKVMKPGLTIQLKAVCEIEEQTVVNLVKPTEASLYARYEASMLAELKAEAAKMYNEIDNGLDVLCQEYNKRGLDKELRILGQQELDKMKAKYIEKMKKEKEMEFYSSPTRVPFKQVCKAGGYRKVLFEE